MKANVITMAALVWAASAMAGEWQRPTVSNFQSIEDQTKGYLYNAKTGMFLINGNDYNTMATLGREGLEVKFEDCSEAQGVNAEGVTSSTERERSGNAWQIRFSINNGLLFVGRADGTYYDDRYTPEAQGLEDVEWYFGWRGEIKADGEEPVLAVLYGNNQQTKLKGMLYGWMDESVEGGRSVSLEDGSYKYVPYDRKSFSLVEESYPNELQVIVANEGDDLTFGIKTVDEVPFNTVTVFDTFTLTYDSVEFDAVQGVVGTAVHQEYFTVGGLRLDRPQRGINIVRTTLSDGSTVTSKILVK